MILDTTFLLDLLKREPGAVRKAADLEKGDEPLYTTSVNVFELWQGLASRSREHRQRVERLIADLHLLPLDSEAAKQGGEIWSDLQGEGRGIDTHDAMVASLPSAMGKWS